MMIEYWESIGACILTIFMIYGTKNFLAAYVFGFIVFLVFYGNFSIDFDDFELTSSAVSKFLQTSFIDFTAGYIVSIPIYFLSKNIFRKIEDGSVL